MSADDSLRGATVDLVVPTVGRPSLTTLLMTLEDEEGIDPGRLVVVDDRRDAREALSLPSLRRLRPDVTKSDGRGPAAARNAGWRRCSAEWVCFVDDDVVPRSGWWAGLRHDVAGAATDVAAVQARVRVPLPTDRPPTDRERNVSGLEDAAWITADMVVRRRALAEVGGFDERFPRAYREDADLALRLLDAGWQLRVGEREVDHPVGPAPWSASVAAQRGNADDALMSRLHGRDWRDRASAPAGRFADHVTATALMAGSVASALARRPGVAAALGAAWLASVGRFFWQRVEPGPRDAAELARMAATSVLIPPAAVAHRALGLLRARRLAPDGPADRWSHRPPALVLFDRDGTLVDDVPYNGDPAQVRPVPGAAEALDALRARGIAVGLVTNQSGVARGLLTSEQVEAVNARVTEMLGPFDTVQVCRHGPDDGCPRRKPAPGMVTAAAEEVGVAPSDCALVGDIGSDVEAALAAGARGVLVPTPVTRAAEVAAAPEVAETLADAVAVLLGGRLAPAAEVAS